VAGCGAALDNGKTCEVTILETQELESQDSQLVSVAQKVRSDTVWVVTGKKKGTTEVRVLNSGDRSVASTFMVTVNNQVPSLTDKAKRPPSADNLITMTAFTTKYLGKDRPAYLVPAVRGSYIVDKDSDDAPKLKWTATPSTPSVIILTYQSGPGVTEGYVVDLTAQVRDFDIAITATDPDDAVSPTATIGVRGSAPQSWTYDVEQFENVDSKRYFRAETIGMRRDQDHTLSFLAPDGTMGEFLQFVADRLDASWSQRDTNLSQSLIEAIADNETAVRPDPTSTTPVAVWDVGAAYLRVTASGPITTGASDYDEAESGTSSPELEFSLTGGLGAAEVLFELMVYYDKDTRDDSPTPPAVEQVEDGWHVFTSATLYLDIVEVK
jgi:hypothetical protein